MPKTKRPDTYSAATTASVISRRLRKAGFQMSDKTDWHGWTEGYTVSRVGYGKNVSVEYHLPSSLMSNTNARIRRREALVKVREALAAAGYPIDPQTGWVVCERD